VRGKSHKNGKRLERGELVSKKEGDRKVGTTLVKNVLPLGGNWGKGKVLCSPILKKGHRFREKEKGGPRLITKKKEKRSTA